MNIKNMIGFAFGPLSAAALGLIGVPIIAWIFSPEDVGRLNIFQVTISFFIIFTTLGLDQAYVREYHEVKDKQKLFKECFIPGLFVLFFVAFLSLFFSERISIFLYESNQTSFYIITLAAIISSYASRFLSLILRMQERGFDFSLSQVLPKFLQLGIIGAMLATTFKKEFIHLLLASFASLAFVLAILLFNTRDQWKPALKTKIDKAQLKKLFNFGFPLVFSSLAFWGINATNTFTLRSLSTLSELAIYSIATSFAGAAVILQSIFSVIWTPLAFKWQANGVDMKRVDVIAQQVLAIICTMVAACGSLAWIIDYLLPAHYSQVKYLILCSIIQPLLYTLSVVTSIGIGIARRNIFSLLACLAALIINIGFSLLLVPRYGAGGAVISNALAFLMLFIANTEASARVWRKFPRFKIYFFVTTFVALSIMTVLFSETIPFHFSFFWALLMPVLFFCFRQQWAEIWSLITNIRKARQS